MFIYKINVQSALCTMQSKMYQRSSTHTHTHMLLIRHLADNPFPFTNPLAAGSREHLSHNCTKRAHAHIYSGYNIIVTSAGELVSPTILSLSALLRTLCLCIHLHRAIKFLPQHKSGSALCTLLWCLLFSACART